MENSVNFNVEFGHQLNYYFNNLCEDWAITKTLNVLNVGEATVLLMLRLDCNLSKYNIHLTDDSGMPEMYYCNLDLFSEYRFRIPRSEYDFIIKSKEPHLMTVPDMSHDDVMVSVGKFDFVGDELDTSTFADAIIDRFGELLLKDADIIIQYIDV